MKSLGAVVTLSLFVLSACQGKDEKATPAASASAATSGTPSATAAPTAEPAPDKPIVPKWMKDAPVHAAKVKVGDMAWVPAPSVYKSDEDIGRLALLKVDAINGNVVSLSGKEGKFEIPAIFVMPIGDMTKLKAGDAVVAPYGMGWGPARVVSNDKGKVTVHFLLSDKTAKDVVVDTATLITPKSTTALFADVYFERFPGKMYGGFLVAQDGKKSWVMNHDSSTIDVTEKPLHSLPWAFKDRKVGDKIKAFTGMGAEDGTIEKVLDAKDYFDVKMTEGGRVTNFRFDQIADKL